MQIIKANTSSFSFCLNKIYHFSKKITKKYRKFIISCKFFNLNNQLTLTLQPNSMGAQLSEQNPAFNCPKMFQCCQKPIATPSPNKEMMQEQFFYEFNVNDLLQSNKEKARQRRYHQKINSFQTGINHYLNTQQQQTEQIARQIQNDNLQMQMQTCKKQLFIKGNNWKRCESIQTNEETIRNRILESSKENQNVANFAINSKILFSNNALHMKIEESPNKSPDNKSSRLISIDSDFLTLRQNSIQPKTPISQNWRHFLSSINRTKFLKSNQGVSQPQQTSSNHKSNKLINYLNASYIGSAEGSIPNGYGQIRYHNGDMLCGYFQDNICEGKGKYIKKDGSLYEGDFVHGQAYGVGIYLGSDGYCYEGEWKNNKPSGQGKAIYSDLTTYEGQFLDGKRHGKGTFYQNGCEFIGQFKNDQLEGKALFFGDNGQTYDGDWKQNLKDGFGEYKWPNGDRYVGNYRNGKRQGFGVMHYQNGESYTGNWKNGLKNGKGTYQTNSTTISGSWIRSKYLGIDGTQ